MHIMPFPIRVCPHCKWGCPLAFTACPECGAAIRSAVRTFRASEGWPGYDGKPKRVKNFRTPNTNGGYRYYMERKGFTVIVSLWAQDLNNRPYAALVLRRERKRLQRMIDRANRSAV